MGPRRLLLTSLAVPMQNDRTNRALDGGEPTRVAVAGRWRAPRGTLFLPGSPKATVIVSASGDAANRAGADLVVQRLNGAGYAALVLTLPRAGAGGDVPGAPASGGGQAAAWARAILLASAFAAGCAPLAGLPVGLLSFGPAVLAGAGQHLGRIEAQVAVDAPVDMANGDRRLVQPPLLLIATRRPGNEDRMGTLPSSRLPHQQLRIVDTRAGTNQLELVARHALAWYGAHLR